MTDQPDTSNSVEGRVVIVTGGGTGIGRAYAKHFADHGAIPIIAEINGQAGSNVAREIEADGGKALAIQTDVSDEQSDAGLIGPAVEEFGRIDVLLNTADIFCSITHVHQGELASIFFKYLDSWKSRFPKEDIYQDIHQDQ